MNTNLKTSLVAIAQFAGILVVIFGGMALVTWLLDIGVDLKRLRCAGSVLLMALGIGVIIYGDKNLNLDEGKIGRLFFPPDKSNFNSKMWKWVLGLMLAAAGIGLAGAGF